VTVEAAVLEELLYDLRELADSPVSFGQETHGELHEEALKVVTAQVEEIKRLRATLEEIHGVPYGHFEKKGAYAAFIRDLAAAGLERQT
jgi:3-methyladenine DNA glycosylase AlkD